MTNKNKKNKKGFNTYDALLEHTVKNTWKGPSGDKRYHPTKFTKEELFREWGKEGIIDLNDKLKANLLFYRFRFMKISDGRDFYKLLKDEDRYYWQAYELTACGGFL